MPAFSFSLYTCISPIEYRDFPFRTISLEKRPLVLNTLFQSHSVLNYTAIVERKHDNNEKNTAFLLLLLFNNVYNIARISCCMCLQR